MAINDYILCKICGVKLLYDGVEEGSMTNREWYKERFGKEIEMNCPPCDKLDVVAESPYVVVNENGNYMRVNPKREPLSDEEIVKLWANKSPANEFECVRLVEKAHGIGE